MTEDATPELQEDVAEEEDEATVELILLSDRNV